MSTPWDWKPFLTGGATRPDAMSGLNGQFGSSLQSMFAAAPPEIQQHLRLTSAFRSPEVQQQLWNDALKKYGSPEAARKWVAPPGNSKHNHGSAADLKYLDPVAQKWAHDNAAQFGLHFPLKHEPWHVEPVGSRGGAPQGLLPTVTGQQPQSQPQGLLGAVTAEAPPETLKLFGWDTGSTEDEWGALAQKLQPQPMQPMQAPQIPRGQGFQRQTDSLARALEAFQMNKQRRA